MIDRNAGAECFPQMTALEAVTAFLLERNQLRSESLERAQRAADRDGLRVDLALSRLGLVSDDALLGAWSAVSGHSIASSDAVPAEIPLIEELGAAFLLHSQCLPLNIEDGKLQLAIADPFDEFSPAAVAAKTGLLVEPVLLKPRAFNAALEKLAADHDSPERANAPFSIDDGIDDVDRLRDQASDAPVVRLVNTIIDNAVELRASDIHLTATLQGPRLRFRIDGVLREMDPPSHGLLNAVISRIKIMAGLDISERRLPQDGRIRVGSHGREIDVRVATMPHAHGEGAVLRLLDRSESLLDLKSLGLSDSVRRMLGDALAAPHGMILVTGPTGSGKTTTLYAALNQIRSAERNIVTVEDPIEYHLDGVNQVPISRRIGFDFASALRAVLRQDPDVIMVGEIRDAETASVAIQAALTGHLVIATVHANSAAGALPRLVDLGVEPYLLAATVRGALAQRLVRRLCVSCRAPMANASGYRAVGCKACGGTGFHGRITVSEFLPVTDRLSAALLKGADEEALEAAARSDSFVSLRDDGERLVAAGVTTGTELTRAAGAV